MRTPTTFDMVFLADNEWGNTIMREVAQEWFKAHPDCNFCYVYEHAGWSLMFHRVDLECVGSANDLAVFRPNRPRPTAGSGVSIRREVTRPDLKEVDTLEMYYHKPPDLCLNSNLPPSPSALAIALTAVPSGGMAKARCSSAFTMPGSASI